jgi:hypothetical protein
MVQEGAALLVYPATSQSEFNSQSEFQLTEVLLDLCISGA